ncbi:MAG: hypothetical protein ACFCVF_01565 [Kineosporiaceae bacterium]
MAYLGPQVLPWLPRAGAHQDRGTLLLVGDPDPVVQGPGASALREPLAQYVWKDIVLVAAGFAVAGQAVGARIVAGPSPDARPSAGRLAAPASARHARRPESRVRPRERV